MSTDILKRAERAADAAQRFIDLFFGNSAARPQVRIPADEERDDDLVLSSYIKDSAAEINDLRAQLQAVTAERDRLRDLVEIPPQLGIPMSEGQ